MAKKNKAPIAPPQPQQSINNVRFPLVSSKESLNCHVLLEDQILLINDFFSPEECKTFIRFLEGLPLEVTPPPKKGEAVRVNRRISMTAPDFAQQLFGILLPHLPSTGFAYPASARRRTGPTNRAPHHLNSNIRLYKYSVGQYFGPHYDDSVKDPLTGSKSEWTLLIYLSGEQDGIEGGETLFYRDQRGKPRETIVPPLTRGTALLHRHGNECLLHEGSPVRKGVKYVLRSDLMFAS